MQRVRGVGGIFFKSRGDRTALLEWYRDHLGIDFEAVWGGKVFGTSGADRGASIRPVCAGSPRRYTTTQSTMSALRGIAAVIGLGLSMGSWAAPPPPPAQPDLTSVAAINAYVAAHPRPQNHVDIVEKEQAGESCDGGGWKLERWPVVPSIKAPPIKLILSAWPACGDGEWSMEQTYFNGRLLYAVFHYPPHTRPNDTAAQVWFDPAGEILQLLGGPIPKVALLSLHEVRKWVADNCGAPKCGLPY